MSFKAVQGQIEKEGYGKAAAGAILAKSTRDASPAAKKANPNLKKVKGKGEPDADDKKKAKKPPTKSQPQWAGIANQMLGNVPATGVGNPRSGNGNR